mgnify:FL=1
MAPFGRMIAHQLQVEAGRYKIASYHTWSLDGKLKDKTEYLIDCEFEEMLISV